MLSRWKRIKGGLRRQSQERDAPSSAASGNRRLKLDGARKTSGQQAHNRIVIVMVGVCLIYAVMAGRLVQYGLRDDMVVSSISRGDALMASRPDLLDRNGNVLATDIRTVSLYAEPNRITDPDEVIEKLATVLPDLDARSVYHKLTSKSRFQWLSRQLTPRQQSEILALGLPGVGFRPEKRRFYPGGPTASHIVGIVNIDKRASPAWRNMSTIRAWPRLPKRA